MEIVGGFMVMMSIISLFLAVVWLIMPFVVFAIKGKQDRTLEVLEAIENRLATLEALLQSVEPVRDQAGTIGKSDSFAESPHESLNEHTIEGIVTPAESATLKNGSDESPAV
jgi:biopolymer transport protein ExbB/TolQ